MLLSVYLPLYPNLLLRMESMFALELAHAVLSSELDLAIISEPAENTLLTQVPLTIRALSVVMLEDHPAAAKSTVSVEDFGSVGWIIFPRNSHPNIYDRLLHEAHIAGVAPVQIHHYITPEEAVQLVSENFGIAFMGGGVAERMRTSHLATRPLVHQSSQIHSFLALRADEPSRLVDDYGRAFLKRVLPREKLEGVPTQLILGL